MQPVREVYSLLMPVQDGRIIVPRAAVAEVMGYSKPKDRPDDAPSFLLGFIEWQNQRIPLISFEAARGRGVPELGRRTRIAVVFGIAGRLQPDVFAVVTQGYPYLVRVNENVLQREEMESEDPLVLARVRMANEKPFIPNFEKLEMLIAESLGIAPPGAEPELSGEPVDELDALGLGDEEDFDMNMLADAEDAEFDVADGATDGKDGGEPDVDLGEVTAFGAETNYSTELDELSEAVDESGTGSGAGDSEQDSAAIDLGSVTAFGAETDYSVEFDELSGALRDDAEKDADVSTPSDDDFSVDLSGFELDENATGAEPAAADDGDGSEVDFTNFELDDDDGKKD